MTDHPPSPDPHDPNHDGSKRHHRLKITNKWELLTAVAGAGMVGTLMYMHGPHLYQEVSDIVTTLANGQQLTMKMQAIAAAIPINLQIFYHHGHHVLDLGLSALVFSHQSVREAHEEHGMLKMLTGLGLGLAAVGYVGTGALLLRPILALPMHLRVLAGFTFMAGVGLIGRMAVKWKDWKPKAASANP